MTKLPLSNGVRFGTSAVFLTAISTILGAVMFLRFGYAVGNLGFLGTLGIIVIGASIMVTYGSICAISFFQHFAADPSYRPSFKSRWYISLTGAVMCIWLMFKMNFFYALSAAVIMVLLYPYIHYIKGNYNKATKAESVKAQERLINIGNFSHGNIYIDTLLSPSFSDALAQLLQLPGESQAKKTISP